MPAHACVGPWGTCIADRHAPRRRPFSPKRQAASTPARADIPALTSIRGIAACWVVLFHFQFWLPHGTPPVVRRAIGHGYLGVDLFFVLSGYVIALNYAGALSELRFASWGRLLWLRIARIYPLHLLMLFLYIPLAAAMALFARQGLPPHRFDLSGFGLSLLLMQSWGIRSHETWDLPAWSISVEWLAYILFPVLLWMCRRALGYRWVCWAMGFGSLALFALLAPALQQRFPHQQITKLGIVRGVFEFWAGACLFRASPPAAAFRLQPIIGLALAAGCSAICIFAGVSEYTIIPAALFFLIWALSCPAGLLARIMSGRLILTLGVLSYSTYMVHMYIREWGDALRRGPAPPWMLGICLAMTLTVSVPLYRFIELPGRRTLRRIDFEQFR